MSAFEVGLPLLEDFSNGKELLVIDVVVELCGDHLAGVEGNGLELITTEVHLQEYIGNGVVKGITFENNGEKGVKMVEDEGGGKGFLEEDEYAVKLAITVSWGVLFHELVEGFGESRVIINELMVEVGETEK
ncbi:hypothetical protein C0993_008290 [Termitomyces sp. T159_Od127]|nr:hypothetical protein C0993_008290 [Termitomyces sp. T159_Od127]